MRLREPVSRRVEPLIRDQADRDAISSRLMRYRDQKARTEPTCRLPDDVPRMLAGMC
jgi:hypothetical protein